MHFGIPFTETLFQKCVNTGPEPNLSRHISQSDDTIFTAGGTTYRGYEPKNNTMEIGAKLGLKF